MAETKRVNRRSAINGTRQKLPRISNPDDNFVYRYVYDNNVDYRVQELEELGYEVVDRKTVKTVADKRVADATSLGSAFTVPSGPNKMVLMRIPKDILKEATDDKQNEVDKLENSMKAPSSDLTGKVILER
jgi:hypothetical protein